MSGHLRYLSYVLRHKWFVFIAGLRVHAPLWRLAIHDWSKFTPREWFPYVTNFYGEGSTAWINRRRLHLLRPHEGVLSDEATARAMEDWRSEEFRRRRDFDAAWLHHQHANPHHWQHWVLREDSGATKCLPMPDGLTREMVADWMGAGRAITGRWEAREWYGKNKEKMLLHPDTRAAVERLLAPQSLNAFASEDVAA